MKRKPPATRKREPSNLEKAEAAGEQYAQDQLQSDYFIDWVREQLSEASRMDRSKVLPLETKSDASVIAKNMLKQLEWDTRRDLMAIDIERMIGVSYKTSPEIIDAFYDGFKRNLDGAREWLSDELLELNREMTTPNRSLNERRPKNVRHHARLSRATAKPGISVRVADSNSMYRGWSGTIVERNARRMASLDAFNQRLVRDGAILVERPNGELFVIVRARSLELLPQTALHRHEAQQRPKARRSAQPRRR
jgi:hypothetical protein